MHTDNTMKETILQALFRATITTLALARVCFERLRASKRGRTVCNVALAVTAAVLYTVIVYKVAERDTANDFERWKVEYAAEYTAQQEAAQEAARLSALPDPMEELLKQENTEFAKLCAGLWRYNYGYAQFRTLGELVKLRVLNPTKPNSIIEVIQQPGQWPGYSPDNEVTVDDYRLAERIMNEIREEEFPCCGSDMILASFDKDKITLRNTMEYGPTTETWWWGKNGEDLK